MNKWIVTYQFDYEWEYKNLESKDPFSIEELKKRRSTRSVEVITDMKSLSPLGSKEAKFTVYSSNFHNNTHRHEEDHFVPNTQLNFLIDFFNDIDWNSVDDTMHIVFKVIIDDNFSTTIVGNLTDNYISAGLVNKHYQEETLKLINKMKSGKKMYLRVDAIYDWNGYDTGSKAYSMSKINSKASDFSKYTYEIDLKGSSKALRNLY